MYGFVCMLRNFYRIQNKYLISTNGKVRVMKTIAKNCLCTLFSYLMDNKKSEEIKIVVRLSSDNIEPKYK